MENNELNCSICLENLNDNNFVFDDIFECIHSHNVCSNCLNKIDKCPICRAKKKPIKNNNYSKLTIYDKYDILIGIINSNESKKLNGKTLHTFIEQSNLAEDMNLYEFISSKKSKIDKTYTKYFKNIFIEGKKNYLAMDNNWDFTCSILMNLYH